MHFVIGDDRNAVFQRAGQLVFCSLAGKLEEIKSKVGVAL
jgi:hypothetical protein